MAISIDELVFQAREQITGLPESVEFPRDAIRAVIPAAIAVWQERTNANPEKRQNFIRESSPITILANVADLESEVNAKGFRLEFISAADIEIAYETELRLPVKFVNSLSRLRLAGRQDRFFIKAYLSGTRLTFYQPSGEEVNGSFTLRSVVLPSDLTDMNESILPELATIVAELLKKRYYQQNRGLDINPK